MLVDGVVGEATYRALKEASYRLGARTLNHQFGAPMYGDDVATLQARLQDLGFYTSMVDGHFGLQTHNALMSNASTVCPRTASAGRKRFGRCTSWVPG